MRGVDGEGLLEVVDALLRLALLALDAAELVVDLGARLVLVLREGGEHLLVVRERRAPVLEAEAHVGQAADGRLVGEVELVCRAERLQRAVVAPERRLHHAELVVERVLLGALPLAGLAREHVEERLRALPLLGVHQLVGERQRGVLVLRIRLVRRLPREHRARVIPELLLADLAELHEEARALPRRRRVALLLVDVPRGLVVVRVVDGDLPERAERGDVARIEIERHLVAVLRGDAVPELLVERLADLVERLDPLLRVLRQLGDAAHVVDGLRRVVRLLVELRERLERFDVLLVEVDHVAVGVDRLVRVADLVGVHLRNGPVDLDLRPPLERGGDVPLVGVDELEPLPHLAVAASQGPVGLLVVRVDLDDLLEPLRRDVRLEELLLLQGGEVHEHVDALALGGDDVELLLEHLHEIRPLLQHLEHPREAAHRLEVRGVVLEDVLVDGRRPHRVVQVRLVERGDPQLGVRDVERIGERRHLPLEHVHQLAVLPARRVDALEVLEGRHELPVHLERPLEVGDGLVGLPHVQIEDLAELRLDLLPVEVGDRDVEGPRERLAELLPVGVLPVELPHLPERAHVVRIELDDLRVVRLRVLRPSEIVPVPLGEVEAEPDLPVRRRLLLEHAVDGLDDLAPAPRWACAMRSRYFAVSRSKKSSVKAFIKASSAWPLSPRCSSKTFAIFRRSSVRSEVSSRVSRRAR